jgi:hypothetical protein
MADKFHCPYRQSALLQQALAPNKMRVAFFLGAGCPVGVRVPGAEGALGPLIPDIAGLTALVHNHLQASAEFKHRYTVLLARFDQPGIPNIEMFLSHLRGLQDIVRNGEIDGLSHKMLVEIDAEICKTTTEIVRVNLPDERTPYHQLAAWIGGIPRSHPVEVFTPNYDLLIEEALEIHRVPYFDGFIGSRQAFFDLASIESDALPERWARLWKLHGSINWWRTANDDVIRCLDGAAEDRQMIYPSHLKYDQSRRLPYLAMLDRLRDFLGRGQGIVVTCGYSFADQHLNEVILNGLRSNPTAMCFSLLYGPRKNYPEALKQATKRANLSLLAADGAVLGTVDRDWRTDVQDFHPLHGTCVKSNTLGADATTGCEFTLGDFKQFGAFLANQLPDSDESLVDHAA